MSIGTAATVVVAVAGGGESGSGTVVSMVTAVSATDRSGIDAGSAGVTVSSGSTVASSRCAPLVDGLSSMSVRDSSSGVTVDFDERRGDSALRRLVVARG
ncbi:hypothetical protein [Mycolicibacterium phlei]